MDFSLLLPACNRLGRISEEGVLQTTEYRKNSKASINRKPGKPIRYRLVVELQPELQQSRIPGGRYISKSRSPQHRGIVRILRTRSGEQEVGVIGYVERFGAKLD